MSGIFEKLVFYFQYPFVWYALIVGVLIALCSSLLGVTLVLKRFSFIGDGLSHVAFGAMAIASVLNFSNNMLFVMPVTVICAVLLLRTGQSTKIKGDAAIAMISVGALAVGYLLMNIFSTAPITYAQAALGGDVKISTVDGDVVYTVKPGTQTDTRIRLKGKGVPSLRNKNIRGDQYVTLVVQVPTSLSAEAKEALRAFDAVSGDSLHTGAGEGIKQEKHHKKRGFFKKED